MLAHAGQCDDGAHADQAKGIEPNDPARLMPDAGKIGPPASLTSFPGHAAWIDGPWKLHRIERKGAAEVAPAVCWLVTGAGSFPEGEEAKKLLATIYAGSAGIGATVRHLEYQGLFGEPAGLAVLKKNKNREEIAGIAKLIVWPEYAVPKDVRASSDLATIQGLAAKRKAIIVFGTQTGLGGDNWQNTALTVDGARVLGEHGKHHTAHFFNDGETGPTLKAIDTPLGGMGTPVCFDCDFQDVVRHMTLDGAEFFAVPSMDAAHWGEKQHIQHAQLFRLRAAENRRPFIVAASSGVSQIIDAHGWWSQRIPPMVEDALNGRITPEKELTFFTRWGWLTPWLALAFVAGWLARLFRLRQA
ncbi:MAG: hypothetical protein RIS79_1059 [Verrucomicrobiota bacterium]